MLNTWSDHVFVKKYMHFVILLSPTDLVQKYFGFHVTSPPSSLCACILSGSLLGVALALIYYYSFWYSGTIFVVVAKEFKYPFFCPQYFVLYAVMFQNYCCWGTDQTLVTTVRSVPPAVGIMASSCFTSRLDTPVDVHHATCAISHLNCVTVHPLLPIVTFHSRVPCRWISLMRQLMRRLCIGLEGLWVF